MIWWWNDEDDDDDDDNDEDDDEDDLGMLLFVGSWEVLLLSQSFSDDNVIVSKRNLKSTL